ncbi:MAG TPA: ImmA/IrrE family metallo-endopeptidase, partial [Hanamia sp.]
KITNFADLLLELSVIDYFYDSEEFIEIPFISHNRFNYIVDKLYKNNVYNGIVLNFDKLTKFLEPKYNVKFEYDLLNQENYLGKIEFNPLSIRISSKARVDKNRWRFTLAHEIGHLILHSSLLKERINEKNDTENTLALKYSSSNKNSERLEVQANLFASYLLLPENILIPVMNSIFIEYRIHRKCLYLDNQPVNQKEVFEILSRLSLSFEASIESIKIRLIKLNLLIDKTDYRIGTLIREYLK